MSVKTFTNQLLRHCALASTLIAGLFSLSAKAQQTQISGIESLKTNLYSFNSDESLHLVDGNMTNYHDMFSNEVGMDDALKMNNFGENFGIIRDGKRLAVEQRRLIANADTSFFIMWNMQRKKYRLQMQADRLNHPNLRGFLEDSYLRTSTPIDLNGVTNYDFLVNQEPGSFAQNRFRVVYVSNRRVPQPSVFQDILLFKMPNTIMVQWSVDREEEMDHYEVEFSTDGKIFTTIQSITAYNSPDQLSYSIRHANMQDGEHHYRVKGVSRAGSSMLSKTASIRLVDEKETISVYPNPVVNKTMNLQVLQLPAGKYNLTLIGNSGTVTPLAPMQLNGQSERKTIMLPAHISPGVYRLQIMGPDGKPVTKTINVL
ncbi:MAG TPA: hypothetical protein DHV17_03900 [Chitinophagaceae bacterium]|nr:hypothetical protein [Chitinophagaceae bacterium]